MARFRVTARPFGDLTDRRRAGAAWPRGAGNFREVLVVDAESDPPGRTIGGEFAIGQSTYRTLKADPELFVRDVSSVGDA
jgi:hypothetical protein